MKAFRFAFGVFFILAIVSCSVQTSWEMAGKWQRADGKETIELLRDGTISIVNGPTTIKTTFRMNDPKRMEISLGGLGIVALQVAIEKDTMTLTDAKGQAQKYKKEPPAPQQTPPAQPTPQAKQTQEHQQKK